MDYTAENVFCGFELKSGYCFRQRHLGALCRLKHGRRRLQKRSMMMSRMRRILYDKQEAETDIINHAM